MTISDFDYTNNPDEIVYRSVMGFLHAGFSLKLFSGEARKRARNACSDALWVSSWPQVPYHGLKAR
jgi:hypothetical protein